MKTNKESDELQTAALNWRRSLKRFDESEPEDAAYLALEAEAAVRRYVRLLTKRKHISRIQKD